MLLPRSTAEDPRLVPGPTGPSPRSTDPPRDEPSRDDEDEEEPEGRLESVGIDGMFGTLTRELLSTPPPPLDDVVLPPPPPELLPPDEPDDEDPPVRGIAVCAASVAGTARAAATDKTTSERE